MADEASIELNRRRALLRWYDAHGRALPWRAGPGAAANPYHVLVSEAMLQQTQVATVVEYFARFTAALPTLEALAAADEQQVLRLWQGLGYYRRARNLHAAARQIVREHGGKVPRTVAELRKLPGVGRYTAGAIASIAFDVAAAIVDGNVARVLARWHAIRQPIDKPATRAKLWSLAEAMAPRRRPGDFNQALMDLGATVCVPGTPNCGECPVARWCRAHATGQADKLPRTMPRRKPRAVRHHVLALERHGKLLFEQRPATGLWSNMWQLPTAEQVEADDLRGWAEQRFNLRLDGLQRVASFQHQTTHRTITFELWHAPVKSGRLRRGAGQWRDSACVDDLPLANPQRKALKALAVGR